MCDIQQAQAHVTVYTSWIKATTKGGATHSIQLTAVIEKLDNNNTNGGNVNICQ